MADITTTIRNAKPGYYVDIRSPDGQIDAFPIERLWELLGDSPILLYDPLPPESNKYESVEGCLIER